jgi:hypothetical protein
MKKPILVFFILSFSIYTISAQSWLWAKEDINDTIIGTIDPFDLTTDGLGNIFETGGFGRKVSFGAINLNNATSLGPFLVKFDNTGHPIWGIAPSLTYPSLSSGLSVTTDKLENVCITGNYHGSMSISNDTFPATSNNNLFIAMFSASGTKKWTNSAHSPSIYGDMLPFSVGMDYWRNIYVTGSFIDTISIDSIHLQGTQNSTFFLAKFDTSGKVIWIKTAKSDMNSVGSTLVIDTIGDIYATGQFEDSLTIGASTIVSKGENAFVAKFDSSGNLIWITSPIIPSSSSFANSTGGNDGGRFLAIDSGNNLYLTGLFKDTVQFGTYTFTGKHYGIYLAKYNSSGNILWAKASAQLTYPNPNYYHPYSISCDKLSNIYLCGSFQDSISFNSLKLQSTSIEPSFLYKFDSAGNAICGSVIDNQNDDNNCVAANPLSNNVFFSGDIVNGGCNFGSYFLSDSLGQEFGFLAEWTCGTSVGINQIPFQKNSLSIFPNPNNGSFTVSCHAVRQLADSVSQTITIYNVLGEQVYNATLNQVQGDNNINISNQPNGIYLYRVLSGNGNLAGEGKIVIQK